MALAASKAASLLPKRVVQLLAQAIVVVLYDWGLAALDAGRALLREVVARPNGLSLTAMADAMFDGAVEVAHRLSTRGSKWALRPMVASDGEFRRLAIAVTTPRGAPDSLLDRVLAKVVVIGSLESELAALDTEAFLLILPENRYYHRDTNGRLGKSMTEKAFDKLAMKLGCSRSQLDKFKADIPHVEDVACVYDSTDDIVVRAGVTILNTYRPTALVPEYGSWEDIRHLIRHLCRGIHDRIEFLLDWLARPVQSLFGPATLGRLPVPAFGDYAGRPLKMRTAIVLKGDEGSGKGTLQRILTALYGEPNVGYTEQGGIDANFEPDIEDKLFVFCNEAMSSSNRSAKIKNKLKPWVTDDEIEYKKKYKDQRKIRNSFNIVFMSNEDRAVLIDPTDRRYIVLDCTEKLPDDVATRIHDDLDGPRQQVAGFFAFLLRRRVQVKVGQMFDTPERAAMKVASLSSDKRFIEDIFRDGWLTVADPLIQGMPLGNQPGLIEHHNGEAIVLSDTVLRVYKLYCDQQGIERCAGNTLLTNLKKAIKKHSGLEEGDCQVVHRVMGGRQRRAYRGIFLERTMLMNAAVPGVGTKAVAASASTNGTNAVAGVSPIK